jgi:hypothetical protein
MSAVQLSFTLRTSENVKQVKLLGSWDNYNGQLPLSADNSVSGGWKGTFRFPTSTVKLGSRYWYYYIIDGHHVSHDPSKASTKEPTTGRQLNILDIPAGKAAAPELSVQIPKGRPLSQSQIKCPKPTKPYETKNITGAYSGPTVDELTARFGAVSVEEYPSSPTSPSSCSDDDYSTPSTPSCSCNRWGITRKGDRVKLDCGGSRCGYSDDSCSSDSESEYETTRARRVHARR